MDEGYSNITVLDISAEALKKTRSRLGKMATKVKWIVADVTTFSAAQEFDVWHDRATFHFLTSMKQIEKYIELASRHVKNNGFMTIGTFSEKGPSKCSGLDIKRYSEADLERTLIHHFRKIRCLSEDHITPFNTLQNFLFCSFERRLKPRV